MPMKWALLRNVSRETPRYIGPMIGERTPFHVKQRTILREQELSFCERLFTDAKIPEDHVEDVLDVDPAGEASQAGGSEPQLLRH